MSSPFDNFPVEDITFKPKRLQSDVLKEIERDRPTQPSVQFADSGVPQVPTIERAIKYYEENAEGEYKKLYNATAVWLRKILTNQLPKEEPIKEVDYSEAETETENTGETTSTD